MRRTTIAACLALALLGCGERRDAGEAEQDRPRAAEFRSSRVSRAMDAASEIVRTRGFAPDGEEWRGFLVDHASDVRELAMRAGTCHVVLAGASVEVRELNLRVFDSEGSEVVHDATSGPLAALRFCPHQSGTYYVAVRASAGSGLFEVRSFRGPTGLEIRIDDVFREAQAAEPAEGR